MNSEHPLPQLDPDICYPIFVAHDGRFDGRVFMGVSSTGIYCRPVCRVKKPKKENCKFYASAARAEAAGFRPCLKCRPELAPGLAPVDARANLAHRAALMIEEGGLADQGLGQVARQLGVTTRHLHRVFVAEYGVAPVQYLQTCRLLLAKNLLTDTTLPVTEVAFAAGFGSVRRFNDTFKKYRLTPTDLRKTAHRQAASNQSSPSLSAGTITMLAGYRPPYLWDNLLAFLQRRAIMGVEAVDKGAYYRTVALAQGAEVYRGWVSVGHEPRKNALAITVAEALLPVFPKVWARLKHMFDLQSNPEEIYNKLQVMNEIKSGLAQLGTRLVGSFDAFEMSVRAILGQQVTVKAAQTLAGRLVTSLGQPIETPFSSLTHTFPGPEIFEAAVASELGELGIIGTRARSICVLAAEIVRGNIDLSRKADPEEQMAKLLALPGFGEWTVNYIAMRGLGWPDAFPHTDYGVKTALQMAPKEALKLADKWRPWRSYATLNLWNSLL